MAAVVKSETKHLPDPVIHLSAPVSFPPCWWLTSSILHFMTAPHGRRRALTIVALCALTAVVSSAQVFTRLSSFHGGNGAFPLEESLAQGFDGAFYGTTRLGGSEGNCGQSGCGILFRITSEGILTTVRLVPAEGANPFAGLTPATNGKFYGTAEYGGVKGSGTIFEVSQVGKVTLLYSFCSQQPNCADGANPTGGLVLGTDGSFYGTTQSGGTGTACGPVGCGTIFRITPNGVLTTRSFDGYDGAYPEAGLVRGSNGKLYGTTTGGGQTGYGEVFEIDRAGKLTTLYNFCAQPNCADGADVSGKVMQASDGNLYGTTNAGGGAVIQPSDGNFDPTAVGGGGTVFKLTLEGKLTTIYSFCSLPLCSDGGNPSLGLLQGSDGNFYGTTNDGANGYGTVFEITSGGMLTTLHSFDGNEGGGASGLLQSTRGAFYGTTGTGGDFTCNPGNGCGTVFSLDIGLGAFVSFMRDYGKVESVAEILGQGLTGTSSVSFNGTIATFSVVSDTYIRATIPVGATTGFVTVITPDGTLTSNVQFQVVP